MGIRKGKWEHSSRAFLTKAEGGVTGASGFFDFFFFVNERWLLLAGN